jgi:hypothetical protein
METHNKLHVLCKKLLLTFRELANFAYPESGKTEQLIRIPVTSEKIRQPVRKNKTGYS